VLERTSSADPVVLTATVHRATGLTLAVRIGAALEWLLSGLAVLALALALRAGRRDRRRAAPGDGDQPTRALAPAGR
jgi:apolipoprotein N-acyltransferase